MPALNAATLSAPRTGPSTATFELRHRRCPHTCGFEPSGGDLRRQSDHDQHDCRKLHRPMKMLPGVRGATISVGGIVPECYDSDRIFFPQLRIESADHYGNRWRRLYQRGSVIDSGSPTIASLRMQQSAAGFDNTRQRLQSSLEATASVGGGQSNSSAELSTVSDSITADNATPAPFRAAGAMTANEPPAAPAPPSAGASCQHRQRRFLATIGGGQKQHGQRLLRHRRRGPRQHRQRRIPPSWSVGIANNSQRGHDGGCFTNTAAASRFHVGGGSPNIATAANPPFTLSPGASACWRGTQCPAPPRHTSPAAITASWSAVAPRTATRATACLSFADSRPWPPPPATVPGPRRRRCRPQAPTLRRTAACRRVGQRQCGQLFRARRRENIATATGGGPDVLALKTSTCENSAANFITWTAATTQRPQRGHGARIVFASGGGLRRMAAPRDPAEAIQPGDIVGWHADGFFYIDVIRHDERAAGHGGQHAVHRRRQRTARNELDQWARVGFIGQVPVRVQRAGQCR